MQQNQPPSEASATREGEVDRPASTPAGKADQTGSEPRHELFEADGVVTPDESPDAGEPRRELFQAGDA